MRLMPRGIKHQRLLRHPAEAQNRAGTHLHLQRLFIFTTSIQNLTDKSMKVILFTKTSVEGEKGGWAGMLCWLYFRDEDGHEEDLTGDVWLADYEGQKQRLGTHCHQDFVVLAAGSLRVLLIHHCSRGRYCLTKKF